MSCFIVRVMAPFTPFIVETMYQNLSKVLPKEERKESVHFEEVIFVLVLAFVSN